MIFVILQKCFLVSKTGSCLILLAKAAVLLYRTFFTTGNARLPTPSGDLNGGFGGERLSLDTLGLAHVRANKRERSGTNRKRYREPTRTDSLTRFLQSQLTSPLHLCLVMSHSKDWKVSIYMRKMWKSTGFFRTGMDSFCCSGVLFIGGYYVARLTWFVDKTADRARSFD